jgi:hypothetical protein
MVIIFLLSLFIFGCTSDDLEYNDTKEIFATEHFNIIWAPDLSNRVKKDKPVSDVEIISTIIENIYPEYLHFNGRSQNQKDSYRFSFINKGLITKYGVDQTNLNIDFSDFKTQKNRIDFVKNRELYESKGLEYKQKNFINECHNIYTKAAANCSGADVWSYFKTHIGRIQVKENDLPKKYDKIMVQDVYRNILVLFTDGYIESGIYENATGNLSYDLSQSRINRFRKAFKKSGMTDMHEFFMEHSYGIVPIKNLYLKNIEVLVLELDDRSLTPTGNATVHPTDAEIIELFWSDWLTKSDVKRFELHACFDDIKTANETINSFLFSE